MSAVVTFIYWFGFFLLIWVVVLVVYRNKEKSERESQSAKAKAFAEKADDLPESPQSAFRKLGHNLLGINDEEQ